MKIKTFYAKSMAEALDEVKAELGPDALLLSTREIRRPGSERGPSGFEVVAATDGRDDHDFPRTSSERGSSDVTLQGAEHDTSGRFHGDAIPEAEGVYSPASLRRNSRKPAADRVSGKSRARVRVAEPSGESEARFSGDVAPEIYRDLVESGVHGWLASKLVGDALANLTPRQKRSRPAVLRSLTAASEALIPAAAVEDGMPGKRIVAFVGPTGVGKTTSLAKLAAHLALRKRKKVVLITLDGYRIGAVEQMRTYAGLMGIPFRFVAEAAELPKALQDQRQRDYVLIDTAGRGPRDIDGVRELASVLQETGDVERHLVLSATTKPDDLQKTVERFEICKPDHLVFTKLDETTTLGPILNELVRTRKPLSYYTDGQRVPEDLHAAGRGRIIDMVLHKD